MAAGRPKQFCETQALERAVQVFWDHGYEATSMSQLVEAMGIGRQSLYNTYGDKRRLFLAALDHYMTTYSGKALAYLRRDDVPAIELLRGIVQGWADHNTGCCRGCLIVNSIAEIGLQDPDIAHVQRRELDRTRGALVDAVARAIGEGSLPHDTDPQRLASLLLTICQGLALLGRGGMDADVIDAARHAALALLEPAASRPEHNAEQTPA